MKIGTQFPECVRDIVTGKIEFESVLIVFDYSGYNFDYSDDWEACWSYYNHNPVGPWSGLEKDTVWRVIDELVFSRKLHRFDKQLQPAWRFPWMEIVIPNEYLDEIPQLRQLWEEYLLLAKLATPPDKY